jgi:DNA-binding CsgD family transcriptional regulator
MLCPVSPPGIEIPLIGRDVLLEEIVGLAEARPGAIVLWGEDGVGRRRLAREVAHRLGSGVVLVHVAAGSAPLSERVTQAVAELGLGSTLRAAGRAAQFVAIPDDAVSTDDDEVVRMARALEQSQGLLLVAAHEASIEVPSRNVAGLDEQHAKELALTVSSALSDGLLQQIADLSDGLPRLIVALSQVASASDDDQLVIPASIARLATSGLDDLTEADQDLVRWAALLRDRIEPEILAILAAATVDAVGDRIDALVAAGELVEQPGPSGRLSFAFRRKLTGAALISQMGPNELRRRSRAVFEVGRDAGWPSPVLSAMASDAGEHLAAVEFAIQGAEESRALNDVEEAIRLANLALSLWRPEHGELNQARAYRESGHARQALFQFPEAAADFERASDGLRTGNDEAAALEAALSAALLDWNRGERRRGFGKLSAFLEQSEGAPTAERTEALLGEAMLAGALSINARLQAIAIRVRAEGPPSGVGRASSRGMALFGYARSGRTGTGVSLRYFDRARRLALRMQDTRTASITYLWSSHMLLSLGRPAEAREVALEGFELAKANRLNDHATVLIGNVGEGYLGLGDLGEARSWLHRAAEGWRILGSSRPTASDAGEGWLLIQEGRIAEALDHFRPLERATNPAGMVFHELCGVASGHATAALEAGELKEATRVARQTIAVWRDTDDRIFVVPLLATAAACGGELAVEAVNELIAVARGGADHAPMWRDLAIGFQAVESDPHRAVAAFHCAAARFDAHGLAWWSARTLLHAGLAGGEDDAAADDLLAARARFIDMNAGPWRQRAEAALRGIGRRVPSPGKDKRATVGDLSAREVEVLQQLMEGLSNREIGERLYIAERTVARHLAGIFSKLGVNNRAAAVALATERGTQAAEVVENGTGGARY